MRSTRRRRASGEGTALWRGEIAATAAIEGASCAFKPRAKKSVKESSTILRNGPS